MTFGFGFSSVLYKVGFGSVRVLAYFFTFGFGSVRFLAKPGFWFSLFLLSSGSGFSHLYFLVRSLAADQFDLACNAVQNAKSFPDTTINQVALR